MDLAIIASTGDDEDREGERGGWIWDHFCHFLHTGDSHNFALGYGEFRGPVGLPVWIEADDGTSAQPKGPD